MLPVSCMRQGMLTKGPTLDPKCKLNISSFVTLPHLLDCLIYTRNFVSIALLLGMLGGDWIGGGWLIHISVWVGGQWVGIITRFFYFCFSLLVSHIVSLF